MVRSINLHVVLKLPRMHHNGPAIKGVSVAERVEAGAVSSNRGRVPAPAVMSEAWRGFCRQVAGFLSFTSVAVQCCLKAGHLSPYTDLVESSGAVTVMSPYTVFSLKQERFAKTVTRLITFIVRVMVRCLFYNVWILLFYFS